MNVFDALKQRKSVRAFTEKEVSDEKIHQILDHARCAPSGVNTQPWEVAVLRGDAKNRLQAKIESAFRNNATSEKDYQYYPLEWKEPFKARRRACGLQLYSTLSIEKDDIERRQEQWAANYRAFDAPVMLLFMMDAAMQKGSYLDYGMFLQSVMLSALEIGLATCPQAALAEYPDIVRQELGFSENKHVICGMALGYEDTNALVNSYRTPREDVSSFTQFFNE